MYSESRVLKIHGSWLRRSPVSDPLSVFIISSLFPDVHMDLITYGSGSGSCYRK